MGGGGLLQLIAYGAQDSFLTGNPQITFFRLTYRRYTNFSIEASEQTLLGGQKLGSRPTVTISRNGDLLHRVYLEVTLPALTAGNRWCAKLGAAIVKSCEFLIGGQRIDKVDSRWNDIWYSLTAKADQIDGIRETQFMDPTATPDMGFFTKEATTLAIPLNFFFSSGSVGQALPLIALQFHEVQLVLELSELNDILVKSDMTTDETAPGFSCMKELKITSAAGASSAVTAEQVTFKLFCDYIYLDTSERRRFASQSHEYLITQVQSQGAETVSSTGTKNVRLSFNHPTKAIFASFYPDDCKLGKKIDDNRVVGSDGTASSDSFAVLDPFYNGLYTMTKSDEVALNDASVNPLKDFQLKLNGHERFPQRTGSYFTKTQPFQHFPRMPTQSWTSVYSFAIDASAHQPSGTLNFSRIDSAVIDFSVPEYSGRSGGTMYVYALSYNILRVLSGMGGLAFSN